MKGVPEAWLRTARGAGAGGGANLPDLRVFPTLYHVSDLRDAWASPWDRGIQGKDEDVEHLRLSVGYMHEGLRAGWCGEKLVEGVWGYGTLARAMNMVYGPDRKFMCVLQFLAYYPSRSKAPDARPLARCAPARQMHARPPARCTPTRQVHAGQMHACQMQAGL